MYPCVNSFLMYIVVFLLTLSESRKTAAKPNAAWMNLIPEKDLQRILREQRVFAETQDDEQLPVAGENFFQDDIIGCDATSEPACPPIKRPFRWSFNEVRAKTVIPFFLTPGVSSDEAMRKLIQRAQDIIETQTCLLFNEKTDNDDQFISFKKGRSWQLAVADGGGFWVPAQKAIPLAGKADEKFILRVLLADAKRIVWPTQNGSAEKLRQNGKKHASAQTRCTADWGENPRSVLRISLSSECVDNKPGNILHLLLHAFGFPKEHTRHDRDENVVIYWENVIKGREGEFNKDDNSATYDDPYDYDSVLHPDYFILAKPGRNVTLSGVKKVKLGHREGLSQYDLLKLNRRFCTSSQENTDGVPASGITPSKLVTMGCPACPAARTPKVYTITTDDCKPEVETRTRLVTVTVTDTATVTRQAPAIPCITIPLTPTRSGKSIILVPETTSEQDEVDSEPLPHSFGFAISPSPTQSCSDRDVTSVNLQTMNRTTVIENATSRKFIKKTQLIITQGDVQSMFAQGPVYTDFDGPVVSVHTERLSDELILFRTDYQVQYLANGGVVQQTKFETRSITC